mmetsp:Transcript_87623/g.227467  ORF Transcript_87623/g.227467 Transcript_87623/m.227467 type:complete len:257 (+) Transcript_87623:753-1523(+)
MLNMICISSFLTSITAIVAANLGFTSMPSINSSKLNSPDSSASSSRHKVNNSFRAVSNLLAFSSILLKVSCSRAVWAMSTITVSTRLRTPKFMVIITPKKSKADKGSSSIIGTDIWPQLSPATICCMNVRLEFITVENALGQRVQSEYKPLSASLTLMGWSTSTAMTDQSVNMQRSITPAQNMAFIAPAKPINMRLSSLTTNRAFKNRSKRKIRQIRKNENDGMSPSTENKVVETKSEDVTNKSSLFACEWKNLQR